MPALCSLALCLLASIACAEVIGETASSVVLRLKRRANDMATGERRAIPRADALGLSSIEETATRTLELTMAGSAASEARWSIEQASLPSWLDTPLAGSLAANETTARWEISVSTDGLAGLDTPYTTTLNVFIDADKDLVIAVPVYLFVSSEEGLRPCPPEEMFAQGVCTPCLEPGGQCPIDSNLSSVNIERGWWRLSNRTEDLRSCATGSPFGDGTVVDACVGGRASELDSYNTEGKMKTNNVSSSAAYVCRREPGQLCGALPHPPHFSSRQCTD